jgi:hypothetical protein
LARARGCVAQPKPTPTHQHFNPAYSHDGCRRKQQANTRKRSIFAALFGMQGAGQLL